MTEEQASGHGEGAVLRRESPEYFKNLQKFFNPEKITRLPAEIHVVESPQQVIKALKRAQALGVHVGVRAGGHHPARPSLIQDGILIDVSRLNHEVVYDPETQQVSFGPGVRVEEALAATRAVNRFFPHGHAPDVAMGGFCLAGGQGLFMPGWGATITEWIVKLEVVVPDGRVLIASRDENQDLFWAARGAGPAFFGVVTRFWSRTIPAKRLYSRSIFFEVKDNFEDLLTFAFERDEIMPKSFTEAAACTLHPELFDTNSSDESVPESSPLLFLVNIGVYADSLAEAQELVSVWEDIPKSLSHSLTKSEPVAELSWEEFFKLQHKLNPQSPDQKWGIHSILNDPTVPRPKLIEAIKPLMCNLPTRSSYGCLFMSNLLNPDENDAVYSLPQQYYISAFSGWKDDSIATKVREVMKESQRKAETVACGLYIADFDPSPEATHSPTLRAWTDSARDKWLSIRQKYDPEGLFVVYKALLPPEQK